MTVGFFSPLPPARTGVAEYSAALLAEIRRRGSVAIAPARCDVALYHLGNNGLHAGIYRRAIERPGVVALHDAVLHHFLLGSLDQFRYIDEFVYNYGEWLRHVARDLWSERAGSASDARYFEYPMLRRVLERAAAVVAHNPQAAAMARRHAPGVRVVEIPHLFQPPEPAPSEARAARFRQSLGVEPGAFLFGVFGYLRESKRLMAVLETFARLRRERPNAALLVAGPFASRDLERAAAPLLANPGIVRLPYLPTPAFWLAAASVDACVNLRHPCAGETSGISIRLMGLGKPALVSESPECAAFPDDAVLRIPAGAAERDSLLEHMRLLTLSPETAREIGRRGAAYIRRHHGLEPIGQLYWNLLCDCRS